MATNISTDLCDICEIRKRTNHAIKWCPECEEKLCDECYDHHSVSKLSRNHEVIHIEQYNKLKKSIIGVKSICEQHDQKFTNFCQQHDQLCCPACFAGRGPHSKCSTLVLQDVIQNAKTSVLLQSVAETLQNHKRNLGTIINDRQSNLQYLQDQKENILKEVQHMKEKIMKRLNDFEKNISDDLNDTINKRTRTLKSELSNLTERLQHAESKLNELNTMKQFGSNLQVFLGCKSMETDVNRMDNDLKELINTEKMKQVVVNCKWDINVNQIIKRISTLGILLEDDTPMSVALVSDTGKQVQVMPSQPNKAMEDITIRQILELQIPGKSICVRGCSVVQNNKTIFSDSRNKNMVIFKENGEIDKVIPTASSSWDLTTIDDNTVAVSTEDGVEIINITTNTIEKTIEIGLCYGLEYHRGSLFCYVRDRGVLSVDLATNIISEIIQKPIVYGMCYCTVYNNKIYTTLSHYNIITCYTILGAKMWQFEDQMINFPIGIAVDNSSNVHIASYGNSSVVVLSPDGQRQRTLLTSALHFNRLSNQLLIGNRFGPGLLFST